MSNVAVIEQKGQRVLTTAQLAEAYETDSRVISNNFSRNKDRYREGKHFFALSGNELKAFKTSHQIDEQFKHVTVLYLWTEKGAWLHAKSLNTDRAWQAYEQLVDSYYDRVQASVVPIDERAVRVELLKTALEHDERLGNIEQKIADVERKVEEQITLDSGQQRALQKAIARRVYDLETESPYRRELFRQLHREIQDRWAVPSYRDVRRTELYEVLSYIDAWKPRIA